MSTACYQCGAQNEIVNQCRCDPNNLPTQVPFYWLEETFKSKAETERGIASYLVGELTNGDAGEVQCGDKRFNIRIKAELVPIDDEAEEEPPCA